MSPAKARERPRRSGRTIALIVGGLLVAAVAIGLAVTSLGSSSSPPSTASTPPATSTTTTTSKHSTSHRKTTPKPTAPANAAETPVAVLNGTETTGLAHRVSGELQQVGYSQAAALNGRPPGTNQSTVVEYASGHRGDAEGVAHTLGVSQVQPMEAAVGQLAGSANVVVVVGADKASASP
jgi:hypothetical protein